MPLEELMISAIDSQYSSPVAVHVPEQLTEIQESSSSSKKASRIRTGVAECQDSFEQAPVKKSNELEAARRAEFKFEMQVKDKKYYEEKIIIEKQKAEQAKAYRPDQQGVTLHPSVTPVVNVSLAADLSANMLSMIRV
jgi:hypothetical protein